MSYLALDAFQAVTRMRGVYAILREVTSVREGRGSPYASSFVERKQHIPFMLLTCQGDLFTTRLLLRLETKKS